MCPLPAPWLEGFDIRRNTEGARGAWYVHTPEKLISVKGAQHVLRVSPWCRKGSQFVRKPFTILVQEIVDSDVETYIVDRLLV